jgi:hypothetical protein
MSRQPTDSVVPFEWLSPLGIAVILFILYGVIYILVGALWPFLRDTEMARELLIVSDRTDSLLFGQPPTELLMSDPALNQLRTILLDMLSGLLLLAGLFHVAITWFGLRQGQVWALAVLAIGGVVVLPFWFLALRPYVKSGITLTLEDIPPFMWVPASLLLPATVLGWIGLR